MDQPIDLVFLAMIIFAMVEFVKSLGVEGNKLRVISMVIGGILYGLFQARELLPAAQPYIDLFLFVVAGGLSASGFFSFIKVSKVETLKAASTLAVAEVKAAKVLVAETPVPIVELGIGEESVATAKIPDTKAETDMDVFTAELGETSPDTEAWVKGNIAAHAAFPGDEGMG
jgi:hypothetical protein